MNLCECGIEVNKRYAQGHNVRDKPLSQEHRQKISDSHIGEKNWNYGNKTPDIVKQKISKAVGGENCSNETREKLSRVNKGKYRSEETKKMLSLCKIGKLNPMYGKLGKYHPTFGTHHTEETRKKISNNNAWKNKHLSEDHKRKMRESSNHYSPNMNFSYGEVSVSDSGIKVRSSYERLVTDWLYLHSIKYEYESERFFLGNGVSYLPDFYLPEWELYVETKGYMSPENMTQHELFVKAGYELLVIDNDTINNLDSVLSFLL